VQEYYQQNDIYHVQNPKFERVPITRAVPVPTPSINKLPVLRQIPVPIPDPNAKGNTHIINETNVEVIGYAKDKEEPKPKPSEWNCPNCRAKADVAKLYGGQGASQVNPNVVDKKSYEWYGGKGNEGIASYWN